MFPSVRSYFRTFNEPFEGVVPYMYLDIKGLVTTGVGNLIDPISEALRLPWKFKAGSDPASSEAITAEWNKLKSDRSLATRGAKACGPITTLYLDDPAIDNLICERLGANEAILKGKQFPEFDTYPADAQLGILSMAWAVGASGLGKFPTLCRAIRARDFVAASAACHIRDSDNPGVKPRNEANTICFRNAAAVGPDPSVLVYPKLLV